MSVVTSRARVYKVYVNGVRLVFSMNPAPHKSPIILYLHGGPGDACIPLTMGLNAELEKTFRFINVDQRGCGLSYYRFVSGEIVNLDTLLEDIHQFVLKILSVYEQKSLILIGHSWGSVLGLEMVKRYPSLISQYVGLGQVVNMRQALELRQRFISQSFPLLHCCQTVVGKESTLADLILMVYELGRRSSLRGIAASLKRPWFYMLSPYYSWKDLINQQRGIKQSRNRLNRDLEEADFTQTVSFKTPVTFISGSYDYHLPVQLVEQYAKRIQSSHSFIRFPGSGHSPQWDEPRHFASVIKKICISSNNDY